MNWLAQNVVGYIPEIEEMNERAQELMQLQGMISSAFKLFPWVHLALPSCA